MEKLLVRISEAQPLPVMEPAGSSPKRARAELDIANLPTDPAQRTPISQYHPNDRDQLRRAYLERGPYQPVLKFPLTKFGCSSRRFNASWYYEFPSWLEYSQENDAAFCLFCYLFKSEGRDKAKSDTFVVGGFNNWKKKDKLEKHVGSHNSAHNQARRSCEALMDQCRSIDTLLYTQSAYLTRLKASIVCVRFLLQQGLTFRGPDEFEESDTHGMFVDLLRLFAEFNKDIADVVLENAPENNKLIEPEVQKEIANAIATEITNAILGDLGDGLFAILVDIVTDVEIDDHLTVALRYVNQSGYVAEHLLGIVHVTDLTAETLKKGVESLLVKHRLSLDRIRGQGYDGASEWRERLNDLKTCILKENESAHYVHWLVNRLQTMLVSVSSSHLPMYWFFKHATKVARVVGAPCKGRDHLREQRVIKVVESLQTGQLSGGQDVNQEYGLKRTDNTRWGSHYGALINLIVMFSDILDELEHIYEDGWAEERVEALMLLNSMATFEFCFSLHLMRDVLGISDELSQALQRKEHDIANSMSLVNVSKKRLQVMKDDGCDSLLKEVSSFCEKHDIIVPNTTDMYVPVWRSKGKVHDMTTMHYFCVDLFDSVIGLQLHELNDRFTKENIELLSCMACLNPDDTFVVFDKRNLIRLAQFYPKDFSPGELMALDSQLETFIMDMKSSAPFSNLRGIEELAAKMVETKKNNLFPLVYKLITLALILPVATATSDRAFSVMKIVKNRLESQKADQWMNDKLITYIENDLSRSLDDETIVQRFQAMKAQQGQLYCSNIEYKRES